MLTFYHAPNSRSSTIATLIEEMGIADQVQMQVITIPRMDGSGGRDPANPHPEGKSPALVHDGAVITERAAIMLHLTTLFPGTSLAPKIGTPKWGEFVTWLVWYHGVLEPILMMQATGTSHPMITSSLRGHGEAAARLSAALAKGPWLLGEEFSAADLLIHSPYAWLKDAIPDDPLIRDWVARCQARPSRARVMARDQELMGQKPA